MSYVASHVSVIRSDPDPPVETPEAAFQAYFDVAWRSLRRLGVAEEAVDDAAQDVFVVAFRRWEDFRGEASRRTWLYGIILRVASSYRRAARRRPWTVDYAVVQGFLDANANPFEEASRRQASRLLDSILDELDEPVRAAFVLTSLEELTVAEAADLLGITESTCRSRLRTARGHVNAAMDRIRARDQWRKG
jgi:RNA polymerase sigma-70 factor (ECF subfamily)